jgi:uncharacterized membrane protein
MTVTANPRDSEGARLATIVTNLTATLASAGGKAHAPAIAAALDQAQRELVLHYLMVGRITAATVLSTLS